MKKESVQDPYYSREASRYVKPVASREYLLEIIAKHKKVVTLESLIGNLKLTDQDQIEGLRRRLKAMVNDGQLIVHPTTQSYQLMTATDVKKGRIRADKDGMGYCIFSDGEASLLISPRQMRQVFDGDLVMVYARHISPEESNGIIVEVIERNTHFLVGHLSHARDSNYVIPLNRRNQHNRISLSDTNSDIAEGTLVKVQIDQQPSRTTSALGHIVSSFDDSLNGQETDIALLNHRLRHQWPEDVLNEAAAIDQNIDEKALNSRFDLRHLPFVTIDGSDSKDFDDAVYACRDGKHFRLQVAIADVSEYVQPNSALDRETRLRGNSVYFPREVIPMLPERLSTGICSLNPGEDRLALVCEMKITAKGKVVDYSFFEAVFRSHARLTYDQVSALVDHNQTPDWAENVRDNVVNLEKVYQGFLAHRQQRGALEIELPELRFIFSGLNIEKLDLVHRNTAHKMIEEAMLAANVCAAQLLDQHKIPALYRTHDEPDPQRLEDFRQYLKLSNLRLTGGNTPRPKDFLQLIKKLPQVDHPEIVYTQLLRTMMKAEYRPDCNPHFGLAYEHYCHFTSPIRRYPDLLVHRAIRTLIHSRRPANGLKRIKGAGVWKQAQSYPYDYQELVAIGLQCTDNESRAENASRDVQQYLRCSYLQQFVGNTFEGIVKAVTSFGLFIEMPGTCSEGLMHISQIGKDYYVYDALSMSLRGERTGTSYSLGSTIQVRLTKINIEQGLIDLEPANKPPSSSGKGKKKSQSGKKKQATQKTPEGSNKTEKKSTRRFRKKIR